MRSVAAKAFFVSAAFLVSGNVSGAICRAGWALTVAPSTVKVDQAYAISWPACAGATKYTIFTIGGRGGRGIGTALADVIPPSTTALFVPRQADPRDNNFTVRAYDAAGLTSDSTTTAGPRVEDCVIQLSPSASVVQPGFPFTLNWTNDCVSSRSSRGGPQYEYEVFVRNAQQIVAKTHNTLANEQQSIETPGSVETLEYWVKTRALADITSTAESNHVFISAANIARPAICSSAPTVSLLDGRFRAQACWRSGQSTGKGSPIFYTQNLPEINPSFGTLSENVYFAFFTPSKLEVTLKVFKGVAINDKFWVFVSGLTDVEYWLAITDTKTGIVRDYYNPPGGVTAKIDKDAFAF